MCRPPVQGDVSPATLPAFVCRPAQSRGKLSALSHLLLSDPLQVRLYYTGLAENAISYHNIITLNFKHYTLPRFSGILNEHNIYNRLYIKKLPISVGPDLQPLYFWDRGFELMFVACVFCVLCRDWPLLTC